jgi:phosphohistidine swiveling domain-containing protein
MSLSFIKMWGAHTMGAGIAEQVIAYNFSHSLNLKSHCGVVEKNALFYFENGAGTQFYFEKNEMDEAATFGFDRFTNSDKTKLYIKDSKEAIKLSDESYESFLSNDISHLNISELFNLYKEKLKVYEASYAIYHACQPQYVKKIEAYVKELLLKQYDSVVADEIYSSLTLSEDYDSLAEEHLGWLEIAQKIKLSHPEQKNITEDDLTEDEVKEIGVYSEKYIYLGTVEANNPWNFDYYLKRLNDDFKKDLIKERSEVTDKKRELHKRKLELIKQHKINGEIITICSNLAQVGLIRLQIRFAWTKAAYISNKVSSILISKINDANLTIDKIYEYRLDELEKALFEKKYLDEAEIIRRKQAYLYYTKDLINDFGDKVIFYSGEEAIKMKNSLAPNEKIEAGNIKGTVACRGKATGKVILFTWVEEELADKMKQMNEGDILVAGQTRPFLMPAIRKAGAIITDEGGITCHAAIVSRELHIPCIIGTKHATQVLKDGDMVEVDADNGIVKILEKSNLL